MEFQISVDDGGLLDLKVADMIEKHDLQKYTTFFIPTNCDLSETDIINISARGFKIGGHTVSHYQNMKTLPAKKQYYEIWDNKRWLEQLIKKEIDEFAYPRGRYSKTTINQVKKAEFKEARTTIVFKTFWEDPFKKDTTIHWFPRLEYDGKEWYDLARDYLKDKPSYFHIWGHSKDLEKYSYFEEFNKFLDFASRII
jgi:peptidoglycan/xylan/chitin deacetylase (PgdA/CDA1 family)